MPLTAAGKLKIVASSDLGALGAKDGPPVEYDWTLPSLAPLLLPWLAILALLAFKPNRRAAAWLIWLPLGCVMAMTLMPPMLPSGTDFFLDVIAALAIGLAAVWLLANNLRRSHRLLTFFCILLVLAGFSVLAFVSREGGSVLSIDALEIGIVLGVGALATSVALVMDGWICRNRYRPFGLYLWLFLAMIVLWLVIAAPFFVFALIASGGRIPWSEFFIPVLAVALGNFATLLPFLILSSASPFFRERLRTLLHVQSRVPPVMSAPAPDAGLKN